MTPVSTKTDPLRNRFIIFVPRSPLKVADIPMELYLFISNIAEINLLPIIKGFSEKNSESTSSKNIMVSGGTSPVVKSDYMQ
jgi:hypothetical protein